MERDEPLSCLGSDLGVLNCGSEDLPESLEDLMSLEVLLDSFRLFESFESLESLEGFTSFMSASFESLNGASSLTSTISFFSVYLEFEEELVPLLDDRDREGNDSFFDLILLTKV